MNGNTIGILESMVYSAVGLIIVFTALSTLAISIVLSTKLFRSLGLIEDKKPAPAAKAPAKPAATAPAQANLNEEEYAVIIAAATHEASLLGGDYQVKSITEVK